MSFTDYSVMFDVATTILDYPPLANILNIIGGLTIGLMVLIGVSYIKN